MTNKEGTIIYIEQSEDRNDLLEAEYMSRSFVKQEIHDRTYINALGADLVTKYLASEGINVDNLHNIHSISKIVEDIDIADILLPNIHLDVRVVYDKDYIFVPKSHFELGVVPDAYVVLLMDKEFKQAEILGYFKPSQINKSKENDDYYFFSYEKLYKVESFTKFVKDHVGKNIRKISEEDMYRGRELSILMADHSITLTEEKELLELLLQNDSLRESILEFDNFETLAHSVAPTFMERYMQIKEEEVSDTEESLAIETEDNSDEGSQDNNQKDENKEAEDLDDTIKEVSIDDLFMDDDSSIALDIDPLEKEESDELATEEIIEEKEESVDSEQTDSEIDNSEEILEGSSEENLAQVEEEVVEDSSKDQEIEINNTEEQSIIDTESADLGDDLLGDDFMDLEDVPVEQLPKKSEDKNNEISDKEEVPTIDNDVNEVHNENENNEFKLKNEEEINTEAKLIENVIDNKAKDLSVDSLLDQTIAAIDDNKVDNDENVEVNKIDGELIHNVVTENISKQEKNLDRIDYEKTDIAPDVSDLPENIAIESSLSTSKMEANLEAENSGEYGNPTNLEDLEPVETYKEEKYEHETVDLQGMAMIAGTDNPETEIVLSEPETLADLPDVDINADLDVPGYVQDIETVDFQMLDTNGALDSDELSQEVMDVNLDTLAAQNENLLDFDGEMPALNADLNHNIESKYEENVSDFNTVKGENDSSDFLKDNADTKEAFESKEEDVINDDTDDSEFMSELTSTIEEDTNSYNLDDEIVDDIEDSSVNLEEPILLDEESDTVTESTEVPDLSLESEDLNVKENLDTKTEDDSLEIVDNDNLFEDDLVDSEMPNVEDVIGDLQESPIEEINDNEMDKDSVQIMEDDDLDVLSEGETQSPNEVIDIQDDEMQETSQSDEWLDDTDYSDLDDVDTSEAMLEDVEISEPVDQDESTQEFVAIENSTVISDKTFKVGEIAIDINKSTDSSNIEENESLESIYDPESKVPGSSLLENPGRLGSARPNKNVAIGLGGFIIVLAMLIAIAFGVAKLLKVTPKENPKPISEEPLNESSSNGVNDANTLDVDPENVLNMESNTDALATTSSSVDAQGSTPVASKAITQKVKQQAKNTNMSNSKQNGSGLPFVEVKKLSWSVPDYISYNPKFKQYLQSVGKSLKLSIESDLLLATDNLYSNMARVSITYDQTGDFQNAQILTSSGSTQIDEIVLRTVNHNLKLLKAPSNVAKGENVTVVLKIYF